MTHPISQRTRSLRCATGSTEPDCLWRRPGLALSHNALAALGACIAAGLDPLALAHALIDADSTTTAEVGGVLVVDSRAGHPTDIAADLATAHAIARPRNGRVLAGYQPHNNTRLQIPAIGRTLAAAHAVVVLPATGSNQPPPRAVHRLIADAATAAGGKAATAKNPATATTVLLRVARPGDVLVAMGASQNTAQLGAAALAQLTARPPARPGPRR